MKRITILMALVLGLGIFAQAQVKVGYTNVELILSYMPETQEMEKTLGAMEKKIGEQLEIKQKYYQQKMTEFLEAQQAGLLTEAQTDLATQELQKLQQEIQGGLQQAQEALMQRRMQLLQPIQNKMQKAIDETAKEGGFTYILNNAIGSGIPSILHGQEANDVTEIIAKKLGIQTEE